MNNNTFSFEQIQAIELQARELRAQAFHDVAASFVAWVAAKLHFARPVAEAA